MGFNMHINLKNLLPFASILLCGATSAGLAMEVPAREDFVELKITRHNPLLIVSLPDKTEVHVNSANQVWVKTPQQRYPATPWLEYAAANKFQFRVSVLSGNSDSVELLIPRGSKPFSFFEGSEIAVDHVSAWVKETNGPGYYATPFVKFAEKIGLPTPKATLVDVRSQVHLVTHPRDIESFIRSAYALHHRIRPFFEPMESCALSFAYAPQTYPHLKELDIEVENTLKPSAWPHVPTPVISFASESIRTRINGVRQKWLDFDKKFQNYQLMHPDQLLELDTQGVFKGYSQEISDYLTLLPRPLPLKEFASTLLHTALPSVALEDIFPAYGQPKEVVQVTEKPTAPLPKKDPIKHKIIDEIQEAWDAIIHEQNPWKKEESVMAIGIRVANHHVPQIREHLQKLIVCKQQFNLKDIQTLKTFLGNNLDPKIEQALQNASQVKHDTLIRPNTMSPGLNPRHFLLETASLVNNIVSQQLEGVNFFF